MISKSLTVMTKTMNLAVLLLFSAARLRFVAIIVWHSSREVQCPTKNPMLLGIFPYRSVIGGMVPCPTPSATILSSSVSCLISTVADRNILPTLLNACRRCWLEWNAACRMC